MKAGKTLLKTAGDRDISSLSGGGESFPRLRKAQPDFRPSFLRDEPDGYRYLRGLTPDQLGKLQERWVFGQLGICEKIFARCGKAT